MILPINSQRPYLSQGVSLHGLEDFWCPCVGPDICLSSTYSHPVHSALLFTLIRRSYVEPATVWILGGLQVLWENEESFDSQFCLVISQYNNENWLEVWSCAIIVKKLGLADTLIPCMTGKGNHKGFGCCSVTQYFRENRKPVVLAFSIMVDQPKKRNCFTEITGIMIPRQPI